MTPAGSPQDLLGEPVRSLFGALDHAGDPTAAAPDAQWLIGQAGAEQHGTRVRFALCLSTRPGAGGHRVIQARYRAYGCPHTLAACEWLARRLSGRELPALSPAALAQTVGGPLEWACDLAVPTPKLGRLLVIEDALRAALAAEPTAAAVAPRCPV